MTPTAALYQFWSSFGITAYPSNRVPEDTAFPFITYEPIIAKCDDGIIFLSQDQPWTPLVDEADSSIVRRYTVITMQFITI